MAVSSLATHYPVTVTLERTNEVENNENDDDRYHSYSSHSSAVMTFDAKIRFGAAMVGKAHLVLVDRSVARGSRFHMICDEHSGDLEAVAAFLCDKSGKADHRSSIHRYDCPTGGFLYIENFSLHEQHRRLEGGDYTCVGAEALREILNHPKLRGSCSLAVYVPDSAEHMTKAEKKSRGKHVLPEKETHEMQRKNIAMVKRCCKLDARQFLRAGFRQVTPPSLHHNDYYHLFAVPSFVSKGKSIASHDEAVALAIVDAPEMPLPPTGTDFEILQCTQMQMMSGISSMMVGQASQSDLHCFDHEIRQLVAKGGAIERSNAIHECAKHGKVAEMKILLRIAGNKGGRRKC